MNPGRELDALVAEKIFGFVINPENISFVSYNSEYRSNFLNKDYSTSIEAAWEVVEKLLPRIISLRWCDGWEVNEYLPDAKETVLLAEAKTAPHAICLAGLAALKAVKK